MYINRYDTDHSCAQMGYSAEDRFRRLLQQYRTDPSCREYYRQFLFAVKQIGIELRCFREELRDASVQDQYHHIDFYLGSIAIDVKGLKRLNRTDAGQDANILWLEISGAHGKTGWIHSPHTNLFAFEQSEGFYVLTPAQCQQIASKYQIYTEKPTVGFRYKRVSDNSILVVVPSSELSVGCRMIDPATISKSDPSLMKKKSPSHQTKSRQSIDFFL